MRVITNEFTTEQQRIDVETFTVKMKNGTLFRIKEDSFDHAIRVLRTGSGASSMMPITITPVMGNEVILA